MDLTQTVNYKEVLQDCYSSDNEFLDKFHDTPGDGMDQCIERDVNLFKSIPGYLMFDATKNKERIGYFGIDPNYDPPLLLGFFVKRAFRDKVNLTDFWNAVKSNFTCDFLASCSPNNQKAIKYLLNRGGELFFQHRTFVIFKFKNS